MSNIHSNIFKFNKKSLAKAIKYLNNNEIVSVPTETVYGLAGNAYSSKAVKRIFKLKKRPKVNPLIVHYHSFEKAKKDVIISKDFEKLYKKFCPGPITFVLKKKIDSKISNNVTAGMNTVAIRFPKHTLIRKILKYLKYPLAIPSANQSSRLSTVSPLGVWQEFKDKVKMIFDGGESSIGIESTVLDLSGKIKILRPGFIQAKELSKVLKKKIYLAKKHKFIRSPGLMKRHYSPGIPVYLNAKKASKNQAFITFGKGKQMKNTFYLSEKSNLKKAAKNLYKLLREIKNKKYKRVYITKIPYKGLGIALNDRLKKAACK